MSHVNDRVRLTTATNPVDIGFVTRVQSQLNNQTTAPAVGDTYDPHRRMVRQEPTVSITTEAIKQAMDLVGPTGLCFDADDAGTTHKELRYHANKLDGCGTEGRSDASEHLVGVSQKGLLLPSSLDFSADQAVRMSLVAHLLTNATKDPPLSHAYDQAMLAAINLTQNPDANKAYALYGFTLLGSALTEITDGSLNFEFVGLNKPREPNGTVWPGKVRWAKLRPTLRLNLSDPSILNAIVDDNGSAVTQADTELQLVQIDPDNHWVDTASLSHIKVPVAGKAYVGTAYQADGESESTSDLVIECATTPPLLFQTGVALT